MEGNVFSCVCKSVPILGKFSQAEGAKTHSGLSSTGYIQMEFMTCCLGRKCQNSILLKNIFNSYEYVLVDNETMKVQKEIENVNSHILENNIS